jgi:hypothetical protein
MKELKKIQLIESPKKEICLGDDNMSSLLGGSSYSCSGTYTDSTFGSNLCTGKYSDGDCGNASDYCSNYSSCTFWYK